MKTEQKIKLLVVALFVLTLGSCKKEAVSQEQKGEFVVELLFEKEGCKMYRFYDGGRYVYWSDCRGKTQSDYTTHSGKTTVTHNEESITTE